MESILKEVQQKVPGLKEKLENKFESKVEEVIGNIAQNQGDESKVVAGQETNGGANKDGSSNEMSKIGDGQGVAKQERGKSE